MNRNDIFKRLKKSETPGNRWRFDFPGGFTDQEDENGDINAKFIS